MYAHRCEIGSGGGDHGARVTKSRHLQYTNEVCSNHAFRLVTQNRPK